MRKIKNKLLKAWFYTKLIGFTFITGVLIGQFMQPVPFIRASDDIMTDRQKHFWTAFFDENDIPEELDFGYSKKEREDMDALIKEAMRK